MTQRIRLALLALGSLSACALRMYDPYVERPVPPAPPYMRPVPAPPPAAPTPPPPHPTPPPAHPQPMSYAEAVSLASSYAQSRGFQPAEAKAHLEGNNRVWKVKLAVFRGGERGKLKLEYDAFSRALLKSEEKLKGPHGHGEGHGHGHGDDDEDDD